MLLAIETALSALSVALLAGDEIVAEHHAIVGRGHAETLMPAIAAVVGDRGDRVTAIVVDIGPGSFTGLRMGLAAARALGLAWGVPVTGVSSLALIAAAARAADPRLDAVTAIVDAGRGQLYVAGFDGNGASEPRAVAPSDLVLPAGTVVAGTGIALVAGDLRRLSDAPPRAAAVRHVDPHLRSLPPLPLYLRAPDAVAA